MNINESSVNDLRTQYSKKLIKLNAKDEQNRINEIENCHHLFVKLRDYDKERFPNVDLSIVECVHCGVTNKFRDLENTMLKYRKSLEFYLMATLHCTDVEYNETTIETTLINRISSNYIQNHLMSDKVLRSEHTIVLYDIAKIINPNGTNEELFSIMVELNNLETIEEKRKLSSIFEARELIERYFSKLDEEYISYSEEVKTYCKK